MGEAEKEKQLENERRRVRKLRELRERQFATHKGMEAANRQWTNFGQAFTSLSSVSRAQPSLFSSTSFGLGWVRE